MSKLKRGFWCSSMRTKISKAIRLSPAIFSGLRQGLRERPINFIDVGARGGLSRNWAVARRMGLIRPFYFEPDADEAERISRTNPDAVVLRFGLGADDGKEEVLHLTASRGKSSLLEPDTGAPFYEEAWSVEERAKVTVRRFDQIWQSDWGAPEFVKIDVQGYETEVVKGFGDLLRSVLCFELEAQLLPFYIGQPLFQQVHDFMHGHGFDLVKMRPLGLFRENVIAEMNVFFVRRDVHADPRAMFWKRMNDVGSHRRMAVWGH